MVIGHARSGTSMTAGLFAKHGCWVGGCREADQGNAKGYYENLDLKDELMRRWGRCKKDLRVAEPQDGFREAVERICRKAGDRHIVLKHGALYWRAWRDFEPTFVCVYRHPESILASEAGGPYVTEDSIRLCYGAMEWCQQTAGGIRVDSERLIDGDYQQVERAFHAADLGFDPRVADQWIDPSLWHHEGAA